MTLYRSVYPIMFDVTHIDRRIVNQSAVAELQNRGIIKDGDLVIITKGDFIGVHGHTNSMKIVTVGELPSVNL
jgi:pyruvate kinase